MMKAEQRVPLFVIQFGLGRMGREKKKAKRRPIKIPLLRAQLDNTQQQLDDSFSPAHGVDWLIASVPVAFTGPDIFNLRFHVTTLNQSADSVEWMDGFKGSEPRQMHFLHSLEMFLLLLLMYHTVQMFSTRTTRISFVALCTYSFHLMWGNSCHFY